ncbi:putative reverse transcriptase zinc-binding domain-containing protein [Helianthus annuus]|nr:putative reverse transcriptase zinc-binding domain-containing protein [Helianthus annuus]
MSKKVNIFACRAEQDRLATLKGLQKRNTLHGPITCRLCGKIDEDANHLFVSCDVASVVWQKVSTWCKIPPIYAFEVRDLLNIHNNLHLSEQKN